MNFIVQRVENTDLNQNWVKIEAHINDAKNAQIEQNIKNLVIQ